MDVRAERDHLETAIRRYLELKKLQIIDLAPVIDRMLRVPVAEYEITRARLRFSEPDDSPNAPTLVEFLNKLFRRPDPIELTAYWDCTQEILGKRQLHFGLSAASDMVGIGGIADPRGVRSILEKLVDIWRHPSTNGDSHQPNGGGFVDKPLKVFQDHPGAQATVLSAGAITASIIWIVADAIRDIVIDQVLERILGALPVEVIIVAVEIVWLVYYYGWRRIWRGLKILGSLPNPEVWRALGEARKRSRMDKEIAS